MPDMKITDFLRHDAQAYGVPGSPSIERILEVCVAAANWIDKLESRLAQVEMERDAALECLKDFKSCEHCKHNEYQFNCNRKETCDACPETDCPCNGDSMECWEWRGVCDDDTEEEADEG